MFTCYLWGRRVPVKESWFLVEQPTPGEKENDGGGGGGLNCELMWYTLASEPVRHSSDKVKSLHVFLSPKMRTSPMSTALGGNSFYLARSTVVAWEMVRPLLMTAPLDDWVTGQQNGENQTVLWLGLQLAVVCLEGSTRCTAGTLIETFSWLV